jgi:hypothetical protein
MARIGYARVSTTDQDLEIQHARLKAEGCQIVRAEKLSGGSRDGQTELATVIEFLRPGDELLVTRLDRLGRDTRDVLNIIHECEQQGAYVTVLDPHVTTRGEMGHVILTVLGMVAQMERRFIKERQREGIERAKLGGRYKGGKRRIDHQKSEICRLPGSVFLLSRKPLGALGCRFTGCCKRPAPDGRGPSAAMADVRASFGRCGAGAYSQKRLAVTLHSCFVVRPGQHSSRPCSMPVGQLKGPARVLGPPQRKRWHQQQC